MTHSKYAADPNLRLLLSQINAFRLGCPAHLRRPTQVPSDQFDVDLIAAHMVTHAATMALGEPLITNDSWMHDISRVALSAIRAVLSLLYDSEWGAKSSVDENQSPRRALIVC
jgi:hypothetical protein